MQKQKLRNNKIKGNVTKRINTKNLPIFILIGLIAMIIIIAVIYYVFLRYSPEQIITYEGYAIEGKTMAENLKSSETSNIEPYMNLIEVKENDLLYKRLNSYYIGESDKKEIDINYPMYINDRNTLWNLSNNTKLITVNYEEVEGYPEFMLTGGVMYNGGDLTRADGNQYIFLKSEDEIYTNVDKIKITTAINEYEIKEFSNIYFTEEAIAYYEMQDGYMQYKRISDIDNNSKIEVNGETLTYKTFLEKLGIVDTDEQNNENNQANKIAENITVEETQEEENNNDNNTNNEQTTNEWQEGMWSKPEVSCTDFEADVYTIRTNLSVVDRAGVITRGVIFEISLDGRLNRRVQATKTGELEITGLQPDTEYEIVGIMYYNDENGVEQEEQFYTGSVTTKSIDTLGTIDFNFKNGTIYSNKIELIHLKINNDINEEVIKGISRLQVEIDGVAYRLSNDEVDQIKAGKEIIYQTSETIKSNSTIRYEITAFDKFGNELKEINNTGETITSKQAPSVSIRATKQDVTEVNLEVTLTNKDNVSLENYRYEIINQSRDKVKEGTLSGEKETLIFTDLDPNGYYQIIIYGDYDLENGNGKQTNQELGRGSFVTRPIASLGYIRVNIDDKEVTQNEIKLGVSIDSNQTDARLIAILDKVEVVIYDEGKNINQDNSETDEQADNEIKRIKLSAEEVEQLKTAEEVELQLEQLTSNTKYKIDVITTVKQGTVEEVVEDKQNIDQIITLKMPAEVQIRNQFVIGNMIDLDIRVEDIDNAVLTGSVRIEVRNEENKLVNLSEMPTNADYARKTYENLEPNTTYRIIVYAPQYNEGSTDETYRADYILKEIEIYTEAGISGKLDLLSLEKTTSGKNLIDVSSKVNWYQKCFNTDYAYGLDYNDDTKILTLGGNNYQKRSYYDLSKYIGQEITISFNARSDTNTQVYIIEKNTDNAEDLEYTRYYTITDISNEWKEYVYTITLSKSGYVGFLIVSEYALVEFQGIQIELGNIKTNYEEFKYTYNANMNISVNDARNEIITNDYYIRIYKNDEQIQEIRYEELGEENKVENIVKSYEVDTDATYKVELLVKVQDRYYELDSQEFSTEGSREIKGITDTNDFLKIQPYGEYIVLNDLNLTGWSVYQYRFGNNQIIFDGKVNFNGHTITSDMKNTDRGLFVNLGNNALIENIVLDIIMNNDIDKGLSGRLANYNYGTIRNVKINLIESTEKNNNEISLLVRHNSGIIENFVVNLEVPLYINIGGSALVYQNWGTIRNGYIYGENIKVLNASSSNNLVGGVVVTSEKNAIVENIYSLVNIDTNGSNNNKANILWQNTNNAIVQNVYSVGVGENTTNLTTGPNIYRKSSKNIYNNYYFTDEIFTSELETKGNTLSLWDAEFQNQIINSDGIFIVDEVVNQGYYPHLNMSDVMPAQEYIELPEVEDADLPDILSTKILEQGSDRVKVEFSVNNPSAANISNIQIENLDVDIISQEYNDGKSTVIAELKNPVICVSEYNILSISTRGAFNSTYTREYEEGERVINVDLYKEIWSVSDWKEINNSLTENYMLMTDLDFINEGNSINLKNVNGIINGNGHSISNLFLSNDAALINNLYGTFEDVYINNFNQEALTGGGLIGSAQSGSVIDNVHMNNVSITKTESGYVGGIVRYATTCTIKNSSVNNIEINVNTQNTFDNLYIGAIVGGMSNSNIENSFSTGVIINDTRAVSSGVGGILGYGRETDRIISCYTEGRINSDNINVGGIVGNLDAGNIENCYSKVDISATNSNIGGIAGVFADSGIEDILNNLSIGNIYTTSGVNALSRIVGSNLDTVTNNYAYENQLINGFINEESIGATLLSNEELINLDLGNSYNYDEKENGILPKLYNTEETELLPNQEDIFLDDNLTGEDVINFEIESIEASKPNTTEAEITISIKNPKEVEITGLEIEDMISNITRNVTQNGITNITLRATPNRYYDSYKLTEIRYKISDSEEEQVKEIEAEVIVQFYKEIYTYEDWQSIEEGTYQNYRLMADIDFSGRNNVKNNITINRLEAENQIYTLKNINLEFDKANTGLIQNVKTSMKNICFENITLTNTASSGNNFGIISSNNGDLENLEFKDITIECTGIGYVGIIGAQTSSNINNILLENITIRGKNYVGGLVGNININVYTEIKDISGKNIIIEGSGNYIGGIVGYQYGEYIESTNVFIENSNVTGQNYTGGIAGYIYKGDLKYFEVNSTEITGNTYVGGIAGELIAATNAEEHLRSYLEVRSCNIEGSGNYIGGITGWSDCGDNNYWLVYDTDINAPSVNSQYIGGLIGRNRWSEINYFQVSNSDIISNGKIVGGAVGDNNGIEGFDIYNGYIDNCTIQGESIVGGISGNGSYTNIRYVYVNAHIKANNNTAGGIIGYMDNLNMTASRYYIYIRNTMVLDTTIEAPTKAGGLIGDIATEIFRDQSFYSNNYIDADVIVENESTGSLIIGGRPDENEYITNTYVYKYSKLNGDYVYTTNDRIDDDQYLVRADLDKQSTFQTKIGLGTTYWNYESLQEGKYPTIKDQYIYYPELQEGVILPTDPTIVDLNAIGTDDENDINTTEPNSYDISTQNIGELPEIRVYPISINEINVDFNSVQEDTSFTYYINGSEIKTIDLTEKTYTFEYNFVDALEVKLSNGTDAKTITINPSDIRSEISLVGSNYAYLIGNSLYLNGELQSGEYVNVYEGYALNNDGQVIDLSKDELVNNDIVETNLEESAKPLHTYEYKGSNIEVYGTYSKIDGNIKLQIYNVRSGKLSAISNSLDMKIDNYIVDNYNDKEYQTILTNSGEIVDLKEGLKYPSNFLNRNIKQIVQNSAVENTEMMVLYNTGKVIVFNYVNGNVIYENSEQADSGLANYITGSINSIWSDYENKQEEYLRSKALIAKLSEMPIEEALNASENNENDSNYSNIETSINNINVGNTNAINSTNSNTTSNEDNYITVYNGETGEYEVYSEEEILEGTEENPVSETEKIKENGLEGIYNYEEREETGTKVNGALIVVVIIVIAIISLIILRKLVYKNNQKNNNK